MRRRSAGRACAAGLALLVVGAEGGVAEGSKPPAHVAVALENRFALGDAEVVVSPPRAWVSLLPNEGDFARFDHRQIRGARIVFRRTALLEVPADEPAAVAAYERYVRDLGRGNFVKDMRPPPSLGVGRFGQCFTLSAGEQEPPRAMRVLFVEAKHLYDARLEVPDRLTGDLRKEFHAILASIRIEPARAPEGGNGAPPAVSTNTPPR